MRTLTVMTVMTVEVKGTMYNTTTFSYSKHILCILITAIQCMFVTNTPEMHELSLHY